MENKAIYHKHTCGFRDTESGWKDRAVYLWDLGTGPIQFYRCDCNSDITKEQSLKPTITPPPMP